MYLELHPNGGKYWRMNYQFQKKEKTLALGVWPQTSLVEARHKRDEAKMLLKSGKDPNLEKKTEIKCSPGPREHIWFYQ